MNARDPKDLELLLAQSNWLQGLARGLVRDPAAADDLVQDTWVAALRHAPSAGAADLRAWMRVVARNFAHGSRRETGRRAEREPNAAREERIDGPDELAARFELQRRLGEAVLALEQPYRDAIVKRYIDGLSTIQVAEQLGISHDAARQRISRGLARLREQLDRNHEGGRAGWMSALLPFARTPTVSITGGLLVMSLSMKLALLGTLLVVGAGLWIHSHTGGEPTPELAATAHSAHTPRIEEPLASAKGSERSAISPPSATPPPPDGEEPAITGEVLDAREQPAAGVLVRAIRQPAGDLSGLDSDPAAERPELGRITTDTQGFFRLPVPLEAVLHLEVEAGSLGSAFTGEHHAGEHIVLRLQQPGTLEGSVTHLPDHASLEGAHISAHLSVRDRAQDEHPGLDFTRETACDATGFYKLPGLPAGQYSIQVVLEGGGVALWREIEVHAGRTTTCDLAVEELVRVHGTVRDAATHAPIPGAQVSSSWSFAHAVRTDFTGKYEFSASPDWLHVLYVRAAGYGGIELPYVRAGAHAPADGQIDFELHAAHSCSGVVLTSDGQPIEGADVAACASELGEQARLDWQRTKTDARGHFTLGDLRTDLKHALLVRKPGFGTLVYEFPASESELQHLELGEVRLAPALSISGSVVSESGMALPRLRLALRGTNADRGRWNETPGGWYLDTHVAERELYSDEQGRFHFGNLATGTYTVAAFCPELTEPLLQPLTLTEGRPLEDLRIVVSAGLPIEGFVRDHAGQGIAHRIVSLKPEGEHGKRALVHTDAIGHFAAKDLPPGLYTARVELLTEISDKPAERYFVPCSLGHVQAGRKDVVLVLEEGGWIHGRVLESDGSLARNVFVLAYDPSGGDAVGDFFANSTNFRFGARRGLALTVIARPSVPSSTSPVGGDPDPDDAHTGRVSGVFADGDEIVIKLPPR